MDYGSAEQRKLLQKSARDFLESEIGPIVEEHEKHYHPLPRDIVIELFKKLQPMGYLTSITPREKGGEALDYVSYGVLLEELARCWPSLAVIVMVQSGQSRFLALHGTEAQQSTYLPSLLAGEKIACMAVTEPNVGSGLRQMETTASFAGSGFTLNGTKLWITNGGICDYTAVLVYTDRRHGTDGMSMLWVDKAMSPFTTREVGKLGLHCSSTAEIVFEDVLVPQGQLIGRSGEGFQLLTSLLSIARTSTAVVEVGIGQSAIDFAVRYARERTQFGRPIAKFQLIQGLIADMVVDTEAARLLTYKALRLMGREGLYLLESSSAKYYACEAAGRTTAKAIDVCGAYGICADSPTERLYRDARTLFPPDGPPPIQKLLIGGEILGVSAFV